MPPTSSFRGVLSVKFAAAADNWEEMPIFTFRSEVVDTGACSLIGLSLLRAGATDCVPIGVGSEWLPWPSWKIFEGSSCSCPTSHPMGTCNVGTLERSLFKRGAEVEPDEVAACASISRLSVSSREVTWCGSHETS